MWHATHTVDILTGITYDEYGDPSDASTVAAVGVPMSIRERSQRVYRHDSQTPHVVRYIAARCATQTPVRAGDRVRDQSTGKTWVVDQVSDARNNIHHVGLTLDLRDITA